MPFIVKKDETVGKNLVQMLRSRSELCPETVLQYVKNSRGEEKKYDLYTYRNVYCKVIEFACALKNLGIKRGDKIGLISDNRREWLITDFAVLTLGAADVPRGCDSMGTEIRFILNFVECQVCFFENQKQLSKVLEKIEEVPSLKKAILFEKADEDVLKLAEAKGISIINFTELEESGRNASAEEKKAVEHEIDLTSGSDLATIIFTSGTTGTPKGVMLTHDNYIAQCEVVSSVLTYAKPGDKWLSVLPVWHAFERTINYLIISLKNGIIYSKPIGSVMLEDMAALQPETMCGVPRLWESMAQAFFRAMKKKGGITLALFNAAVATGKAYSRTKELVCGLVCRYQKRSRILDFMAGIVPFIILTPANALFELIIYRKIRAKFGGHMKHAISGGGSLQPETDAFYHAINFRLLEGYGITEAAPVLSVRSPEKPRSGCVGEIYPSAKIKVVAMENGEPAGSEPLPPGKQGLILAHGRQIMKGYYKRDDLTAKVIDSEGWLNTGDIGMMTYDNEIKISGRAKDTIVLLGGENIEPLSIEQAICASKYVETAVLQGQDQKYIASLIVPAKDVVIEYAAENNIAYETYESLLEANEIQELFRREIDSRICAENGFRTCERIYKFALLGKSFEQGKEINAKMEVMRHKVAKIYQKQILSMF